MKKINLLIVKAIPFLFFVFLWLVLPKTINAQSIPGDCNEVGERCCFGSGSPRCVPPYDCDPATSKCVEDPDCGRAGQPCCAGDVCFDSKLVCAGSTGNRKCQSSPAGGPTIPVYDPGCSGEGFSEGVKTALGCLPTEPQQFTNRLLPWAVFLGAGIAFLLGVFGAMMIVLSAGNPEKMQAGKEMITSAIGGLILIIFAVFLLRFIGVDILGLFEFRGIDTH